MSKVTKIMGLVKSKDTLTDEERNEIIKASEDGRLPQWLINLLKVIVYAIGLVLAGVGTASAATFIMH